MTSRHTPEDAPPGPPEESAGSVVLVDDDAEVRRLLRKMLEPAGYSVEEFGEAAPAVSRILEQAPDLVFLDIHLPDRSGHDVLEEIRSNPATRLLPVVMLTGFATTAEKIRAHREGVTDFLSKPFSPEELLPRVRSLVTLKRFADEHEHAEHVILTLARLIDARDPHTAGHSGRAAEYADSMARLLGLDPASRAEMRRGALFLDLGKIVIPDAILHKPGSLTPEERRVVEEHPVVGFDLLEPMQTMRKSLAVVRSHHEKLDGSGYPDGLSESQIPMNVRIVTVADVFDALTNERAYREAIKLEISFEILREGVGKGWWDADVVDALRGVVEQSGVLGRAH